MVGFWRVGGYVCSKSRSWMRLVDLEFWEGGAKGICLIATVRCGGGAWRRMMVMMVLGCEMRWRDGWFVWRENV